ncbi:PREDICTED: mitochondrial fission 1 protein-like [Priapulus caudatus]|uniref:Mitochondrial fission 1 protein n=1 Tax=Priapulus caudatus TaxID=37621 RepID=A0ABM1FBB3_PRICU|nr:PREDICTED: mitochondrial fission 1 protein-like [Priapulus caudatus]XP_014681745.1 PREDICTED: mitochondrial fission 1 protein-like [Priapulus caudatus]
MENIVDDVVSPEDLKKYETIYTKQLIQGDVNKQAQFDYAWCLIRSKYQNDMKKGIDLFKDLYLHGDVDAKRDYIFYIGVAQTRLKNYTEALRVVHGLLEVEPTNWQAKGLEHVIKERMKKEAIQGAAVVGGVTMAFGVVGGLIALSMALSKKS